MTKKSLVFAAALAAFFAPINAARKRAADMPPIYVDPPQKWRRTWPGALSSEQRVAVPNRASMRAKLATFSARRARRAA